jgi:hypothetical protein
MTEAALINRTPGIASSIRMRCFVAGGLALAIAASTRVSGAQTNAPKIRGAWGLRSGTQYPPGAHPTVFYHYYFPDELVDKNGVAIDQTFRDQIAAPAVLYVSPKPIFRTYWGVIVAQAFTRTVSTRTSVDAPWGIGDTFVQPVYLGWNLSRLDARTGFLFVAPTGRFHADAHDNHGLGMWSYAADAGVTVYPDSAKRWNLATLATFNTNSNQRGTDRRTGNVLTLEGGIGRSLRKIGATGLACYAQWKVSDDQNMPITRDSRFNARHRYFGLGARGHGPPAIQGVDAPPGTVLLGTGKSRHHRGKLALGSLHISHSAVGEEHTAAQDVVIGSRHAGSHDEL